MRDQRKATINDLRVAIDCLPRDTRVAMLKGISTNEIIVGAYTDGGGVCPMLAAHRNGGRTNFIAFARAWDRFAFRGTRVKRARRATERELLILRTHLEASLLADEAKAGAFATTEFTTGEFAAAINDHLQLVAERPAREERTARSERPKRNVRPGDPDRSRELRTRTGWRWMRVVRSYDEYERLLEVLDSEREALAGRELEHIS
jgi:hypothetical protein